MEFLRSPFRGETSTPASRNVDCFLRLAKFSGEVFLTYYQLHHFFSCLIRYKAANKFLYSHKGRLVCLAKCTDNNINLLRSSTSLIRNIWTPWRAGTFPLTSLLIVVCVKLKKQRTRLLVLVRRRI